MSNPTFVSVDLGYGYVKAIASNGNRVQFPSLVGKGYERGISGMFGNQINDLKNIHINYDGDDYFVGDLAKESRSVSRIFERERFSHVYTNVLLNVAIQLLDVESSSINLFTGLPLDFYQSQSKEFKESLLGMQPTIEWKAGPLAGERKRVNVNQALVFPQGASAIFSALINHEGSFTYPHLMDEGNLIALIDIGFRTTDYIVVEMQKNGAFVPLAKLSGTIDEGVINLHRDIRQAYKAQSGGADLNEFHLSRILKNGYMTYKGKRLDFSDAIKESKQAISSNIADRLKATWAEESDLFDSIFLAGGGGIAFEQSVQPHFDNRLVRIEESQYANSIGYLRLGKVMLNR